MVNAVKLAAVVKRLRESRGLSQAAVVDRADGNISSGHLGNVEAGKGKLSAEMCQVLALALGLDDDEYADLLRAAGKTEPGPTIAGVYERLGALESRMERLERGRPKGR